VSTVSIQAALEVAVDSINPALPTAWRNDSFNPTKDVAWQRVTFLDGSPENIVVDASYRDKGLMRISLFHPLRIGTAEAGRRFDLIKQTFKRKTVFTKDSINVITKGTPKKVSEGRDIDWWATIIDVSFYADIEV